MPVICGRMTHTRRLDRQPYRALPRKVVEMKKIIIVAVLFVALVGCAPWARLQRKSLPILYDKATISTVADNVLLYPPSPDSKELTRVISLRLNEEAETAIAARGNMKIVPVCGPRTLRVVQKVTSITGNTITDTVTGFFVFQLLRGSATSTKNDMLYINTATSIADCESGEVFGTYPYQGYGQNPIETLQNIATYNVYYIYEHQRGK